jgi:hypothetical protein
MSTQPPNPQLMGRTNVAMAVAQPKPKPASKANSTPKGKMQMHRRSRTGLLDFFALTPIIFPFLSLRNRAHLLTLILQDATHADYEERNATKAHQPVPHANILDFGASTRDPCGGATTINDGSKKTTSK